MIAFLRRFQKLLLASLALALGALAMAGTPYPEAAGIEPLDASEIHRAEPLEVARYVVEGRTDLRILDLRSPEAYAEEHLPRAESMPLDDLAAASFQPTDLLVVYGDEDDVALAMALLRAKGHLAARALAGGLEAWQREILHPVLAEDASPQDAQAFRLVSGISLQLGGEPEGGDPLLLAQTAKPRPKLELPAAASLPTRKKKRSEGC